MKIQSIALSLPLLLLAGCAGLLGGGKPADLYRLEIASTAPAAAARPARRTVLVLPVQFTPQSSGDRILTVRGPQAMYVKGARWISPVPDLFATNMERSFAARAPDILLTSPREPGGAGYALLVMVQRFAAIYPAGSAKLVTPTVQIEGEARLLRASDHRTIAARRFSSEAHAADNRVTAIVEAFDTATDRYLADLVDWASRSASTGAAPIGIEAMDR